MRKIFVLLIFVSCFLLTGCGNKSFILMKSEPLTSENAQYFEQYFQKGQRIYYAIVKPDGFKDDAIKIEIVRKNDKSPSMGYSIQYAQDLPIDKSKDYYTNYFMLHTSGLFFMQVFELRRPDKCIARYDFRVK